MIDEQKKAIDVVAELGVKRQHMFAEATEALGHGKLAKWNEFRALAKKVGQSREELERWVYEKAYMMAREANDPEAVGDFERLTEQYARNVLYAKYVDERIAEHDI